MRRGAKQRGLSLIVAVSMLVAGCGGKEAEQAPEADSAVAVRAVTAQMGTLCVSSRFVGTVSPQQQVSVMPLVSGEVDAVYAEVGDQVQAGDVLFHINDEAARLQVENAKLSKQGAEIAAQTQLGSAQVMNNISMQSNIRSIEFQIENAKAQYDSAVDGIVDAREAKAELEDAVEEINRSVNDLENRQRQMEKVISRAGQYVKSSGFPPNTTYAYEVAYNRPLDPDHYEWGQAGTRTGLPSGAGLSSYLEGKDDTPVKEEGGEENGSFPPHVSGEPAAAPDDTPSAPGETDPAPDDTPSAPGETDPAPDDTSSALGESAPVPENMSSGPDAALLAPGESVPLQDPVPSVPEGTAAAPEGFGLSYFSVERVWEGNPQYLAAEMPDIGDAIKDAMGSASPAASDGYVPALAGTSKEEAWGKYYRQAEIDSAKHDAEEMGYSAEDIGSGRAQAQLLENSAQIVALQYQASQLQGNQASVDSSIKQAESARDTTSKTIDFYQENLEDAQVTYGIANGQAYQDTAGALSTQIQAADVGVRSAQMQLEYYSPTTPISGTVVSKTVEQYGLVQPGYAAYVISNQDAMNITFAVSGQVRETLQVGMPVTIEKSGSVFSGTITEIGEAADQQIGGLFAVKAVTETDGTKLAAGTSVKLTVDTFRTDHAVLVPYDAVHFESEQAYVFVIKDGKAFRTPVTVGLMNDDMVEIAQGLEADSKIVATWSSQLEDGANVRIIGESQEAGE